MKIAIVQFDNRPMAQLGAMTLLLQRNAAYAARHGYAYQFLDRAYFDLPTYWQKPSICHRFLQGGYDLVVWLDTDAVVHDLDVAVETLFEGSEVMVAAGDNPLWAAPFNAGVFAVKAADGGLELMARWMALFAGTSWTRTETAWVCQDEWAGPSYEQGAFNLHLLERSKASGALRLIDWRRLQSPFPVPEAFTLHFPGPFKPNIPVYLSTLA